jgi:beta-alanine--pyruvate transaminase
MTPPNTQPAANNLDAFFMPFTANRQFKKNPRLLAKAKGVHYWTPEGRKIIDGTAGLWCVNAGHGREEIKAAIAKQLDEMDYAPSFQMGHPKSFELAARHAALLPGDLNHAFYCNSGSEAVDSALKIALAYHRANGQGTRTRFVGRERGYHGVGLRRHLGRRHGQQPQMVHPAGGSRSPAAHPPAGQRLLQGSARPRRGACRRARGHRRSARRLQHRRGHRRALRRLDRLPATAQGLPGAPAPDLRQARHPADLRRGHHRLRPLGHRLRRREVRRHSRPDDGRQGHLQCHRADGRRVRAQARLRRPDAGPGERHRPVHGYTYSAHPLACAAASAVLDIYRDDKLFERSAELSPYWEEGVHSLKGLPNVTDIRNLGLAAGIDLAPKGAVGTRGYEAFTKAFELGLMVRQSGDAIAMSPPLVIEKAQIDEIIDITAKTIKAVA